MHAPNVYILYNMKKATTPTPLVPCTSQRGEFSPVYSKTSPRNSDVHLKKKDPAHHHYRDLRTRPCRIYTSGLWFDINIQRSSAAFLAQRGEYAAHVLVGCAECKRDQYIHHTRDTHHQAQQQSRRQLDEQCHHVCLS
jgi:uncharacterized short protein YbdD (DUF466 family)